MHEATQELIDARFREMVRPIERARKRGTALCVVVAALLWALALAGSYAIDVIVVRGLSGL